MSLLNIFLFKSEDVSLIESFMLFFVGGGRHKKCEGITGCIQTCYVMFTMELSISDQLLFYE